MDRLFMAILDSREDRRRRQGELIEKYRSSLISFTVNSPGIYKGIDMYKDIHKIGYREILRKLHINSVRLIYKELRNKDTGSEAFIVVDLDGKSLKHMMVDIEEEHQLGRIFDIDVFIEDGSQLSRKDIARPRRKCLICNKEAIVCMREKNHSYEEVIEKIEERWLDYKDMDD